eukprot:evm.model.scf_109.8 EVM.evm.TU.scf_109.8   scf_109:90306-91647(-)
MDSRRLALLACLVIAGTVLSSIPVADAEKEGEDDVRAGSWADTRGGPLRGDILQGAAHPWTVSLGEHADLRLRKLLTYKKKKDKHDSSDSDSSDGKKHDRSDSDSSDGKKHHKGRY